MICFRLLSFALLLIAFNFFFFFSSSSFIRFSNAAAAAAAAASHPVAFHSLLPAESGSINEVKYGAELSWPRGSKKLIGEGPISEPIDNPINSPLVLAPERTYRKDPLDGFKRYTGGWNIGDRHYWASVGYTAAPLFAIAAVWFLGFGLCLLIICLCSVCCKRQSYGYSRVAYALSLVCLVVFSLVAIIGCIVLYTGQGRFIRSATATLDYVVNQADDASDQLTSVGDYISSAKLIGVDQVFLPSNVQTDIDEIGARINSSASMLVDKTLDNKVDIKDFLDSVRLALIVISAIMLVLIFLGFLFSIFGMQFLVYILVFVGWIVVTGTFILCGTFLLLHNVTGDTCHAMDQWVQSPTAHTALDDILPCMDKTTAQDTLLKSREITSQLVEVINQVITNVSNINFSPNFKPMYFNQSGPLVPVLCNPYNADLTARPCSAGEVDLNNATQVWRNNVCQVSPAGICVTTGRLNPTFYTQMAAAVNVSYGLINYAPFLIELGDCSFARETFSNVSSDHCAKLERYTKWIYIGLVMASTALMLSLIFWVIYGRERRHRLQTKQLEAESAETLETDKQS